MAGMEIFNGKNKHIAKSSPFVWPTSIFLHHDMKVLDLKNMKVLDLKNWGREQWWSSLYWSSKFWFQYW